MTVKKKTGGSIAARLAVAEEKAAARLEEVRAAQLGQIERAHALLSPEDRASIKALRLLEEDGLSPEEVQRIGAALLEVYGPDYSRRPDPRAVVIHPAKEEAAAWAEAALGVPEHSPLLAPPLDKVPDFTTYFEALALAYLEEARAPGLPEEARTLARGAAGLERFVANICRIVAGQA